MGKIIVLSCILMVISACGSPESGPQDVRSLLNPMYVENSDSGLKLHWNEISEAKDYVVVFAEDDAKFESLYLADKSPFDVPEEYHQCGRNYSFKVLPVLKSGEVEDFVGYSGSFQITANCDLN